MGVGRFIAVAIVGVCAGLAIDGVRPASAQFLTMPSLLSPAPAPAPAPVQAEEPAPAPAPSKAKPKTAKAKPKPKPAVASDADGEVVQPVAARAPAKAAAKPAAAKAAAKPVAGKNTILVDNRREATLVELTISSKDRNGGAAVIARDVSPGGRVNAKLPAKGGCIWDVSGSFDDESTLEVASVNLCKDPRLTLVE